VASWKYPEQIITPKLVTETTHRNDNYFANTLAEMYFQGKSDRKVKMITKQLYGLTISAIQVGRAMAHL